MKHLAVVLRPMSPGLKPATTGLQEHGADLQTTTAPILNMHWYLYVDIKMAGRLKKKTRQYCPLLLSFIYIFEIFFFFFFKSTAVLFSHLSLKQVKWCSLRSFRHELSLSYVKLSLPGPWIRSLESTWTNVFILIKFYSGINIAFIVRLLYVVSHFK